MFSEWSNHEYTSWALDAQTIAKNDPAYIPNRTSADIIGGPGLEWGTWFEFQKETERLGEVYIPLLVDMFNGSVRLLPREERQLGNTCVFPPLSPFHSLTGMHTDGSPL
jgi:hypothetical protein